MDDIARLPNTDRADLFKAAADARGLPGAIIEKDFWVCWVLKRLFELPTPPAGLLFKGGTSLSKVYGVIDRFSEDVDLSFDRAGLGFGGPNDPMAAPSRKKRSDAVERLAEACKVAVRTQLRPQLLDAFAGALQSSPSPATWGLDSAPDDPDDATLLFRFPATDNSKERSLYIAPVVRLELGARSDHWPATDGTVSPYAADAFPKQFKSPSCTVRTLAAERTFWEKATLLHKWHHAPQEKAFPERQSRHYYDLYRLNRHPLGASALRDMSLLESVARHKQVFFEQGWAKYDLAKPGTLRLVPPESRIASLKQDYRSMRQMIFSEPPAFDALMQELKALEDSINTPS